MCCTELSNIVELTGLPNFMKQLSPFCWMKGNWPKPPDIRVRYVDATVLWCFCLHIYIIFEELYDVYCLLIETQHDFELNSDVSLLTDSTRCGLAASSCRMDQWTKPSQVSKRCMYWNYLVFILIYSFYQLLFLYFLFQYLDVYYIFLLYICVRYFLFSSR